MSELKHYGVLGMRWGRRKQKSTYAPDELKKTYGRINLERKATRLSKRTKLALKGDVTKMSDKESREFVNSPGMKRRLKEVREQEIKTGKRIARAIILAYAISPYINIGALSKLKYYRAPVPGQGRVVPKPGVIDLKFN